MKDFWFNVDVVGTGICNLKCPSCPVGNSREVKNATGFMSPEMLDQILEKATRECNVTGVGLFNWTEPLLHSRLTELIDIIHRHHLPSFISSNLNLEKDYESILAHNPSSFRISLSGFNQDTYGRTHRGGNIETVKKNMLELAAAKQRLGVRTQIHVLYHRYQGNFDDELLMKEFADSLGIEFQAVWAFFMPIEKLIAFTGNDGGTTLTPDDYQLIDRLALPLPESLEISRKHQSSPCILKDEQITLDFQGNVLLCCGVYDTRKFTLGSFLATPLEEIQSLKQTQDICSTCMKEGLHVLSVYGAAREYDEVATVRYVEAASRQSELAPLPMLERRGHAYLHGVDWTSEAWKEVLRAYVEAFESSEDVTLLLWADPSQGVPLHDAHERIVNELNAAGIDPEMVPDMLLVPDEFDIFALGHLYASVDYAIPHGSAIQAAHANRACTPILADLTPEGWRATLKL